MAKIKTSPSTKMTRRNHAIKVLELLEKDLESLIELYAKAAIKSLDTIGRSAEEILQIVDGEYDAALALRKEQRYARAEQWLRFLLEPPRSALPLSGLEGLLYDVLPVDACDKLMYSIIGFRSRFLVSDVQWKMDGSIAASLQLSRSGLMLAAMLEGARKLIEIGFDKPRESDEERRGWIAADYVQFVHDHSEFLSDLDRFRARLLEASAHGNDGTRNGGTDDATRDM